LRRILLVLTHALALGIGFAAGIYARAVSLAGGRLSPGPAAKYR